MSLFEYNEEEELRKRDQVTFEDGWEQGAKQEMQRGIRVAADIYKTMGTSFKEAVAHIAEAFSFSLPEAEQEVKKYW